MNLVGAVCKVSKPTWQLQQLEATALQCHLGRKRRAKMYNNQLRTPYPTSLHRRTEAIQVIPRGYPGEKLDPGRPMWQAMTSESETRPSPPFLFLIVVQLGVAAPSRNRNNVRHARRSVKGGPQPSEDPAHLGSWHDA
jgi:hypothetical protein